MELDLYSNASIELSPDKMNAFITLYEPEPDQNHTVEKILQVLAQKGINFGIKYETIEKIVKESVYNKKIMVADGKYPVSGEDGKVEFHFELNEGYKPVILENGKVDFRNLDLVKNVEKGQVLCTLIPPGPGIAGMDVLGSEVLPHEGKASKLPIGKNVEISEDGKTLISTENGQVSYLNEKINVFSNYEVIGNVDNSTGNINFVGNVIIRGNVLAGFTVIAGGNIDIWGVVEGATVVSAGNIVIKRGVLGNNKAVIKSNGDVFSRFIESSYVEAKNDIRAEAIMHSTVKCGRDLVLEGRRGLLVGGNSLINRELTAKVIGSQMATVTNIEVDIDGELREKHKNVKAEINSTIDGIKKSEQIITILSKLNSNNMLAEDKKDLLEKTLKTKDFYDCRIVELNDALEKIQDQLYKKSEGKIRCLSIIHPGVKITIGSSSLNVKEELQYCLLYSDGVDVKVAPLS